MLKSMTGYGRGEAVLGQRSIVAEVRSVNNRYLDCSVRLPRLYAFAEDAVKARVQAQVTRGKVDVYLTIDSAGADAGVVRLNEPAAAGYHEALVQLRDRFGLKDDISVSLLSRFPDVFTVEKPAVDMEAASEDICRVVDMALADFDGMRRREGERLARDILSRADTIEALAKQVEARSPETVREYRARLEEKMREVLAGTQIDEARLLTEAAIFADKVAVDEETVRLSSHLAQLRQMLSQGGAVGRKLDFLIQEFNREANTIGSKCCDLDISRLVVDIKGEIEKIREQVQNIE